MVGGVRAVKGGVKDRKKLNWAKGDSRRVWASWAGFFGRFRPVQMQNRFGLVL